ncbi:hypothetical protein C8R11_101252 [Nitrosomonas aestuarii]|nr:hypothetical protein C8R11_101252 [Nitrosomonas aestuarii]
MCVFVFLQTHSKQIINLFWSVDTLTFVQTLHSISGDVNIVNTENYININMIFLWFFILKQLLPETSTNE